MTGTVTTDGVPLVLLTVAAQTWPAIIDTGFNGDLELPVSLRASLKPRFLYRTRSVLAGGQTIDEDLYAVDFPFDGTMIIAEATFSPSAEILIGTHLLAQYRLEINFPDRSVELHCLA